MGKVLWTSSDAAAATGGKAVGDWAVTGLSIDTRSLQPGDLFVPLKDVRDGHDFIPQARSAGAGAILSERGGEPEPCLIVEDTLQAMRDLAVAARERSSAVRIAVTGSVGKTSVKEALAVICTASGHAHKSLKSFNNHWGVPLTLATMPIDTDYGVFEIGMNHAGELSDLSPLAAPHIAIITKIAPAHLAHFDSVDDIAAAKAEIFEGLPPGGTAILNADDAYFSYLSGRAKAKGAKILTFGSAQDADVRIDNPVSGPGYVSADLTAGSQTLALRMNVDGLHWVSNAACAVAGAWAAGIDFELAVKVLSTFEALSGRGERIDLMIDGKSVTLIDDSYNANPVSMRAGIEALSSASGRKYAVLGDMHELGADELAMHAALSGPLQAADVSRVITVGECMRALRGALPQPMRGAWAANWQSALTALLGDIRDGDTVLIKGSNAAGLSNLVTALKNTQKGDDHAV